MYKINCHTEEELKNIQRQILDIQRTSLHEPQPV